MREQYWTSMVAQFGQDVYLFMRNTNRNRQLAYMLGRKDDYISRATDKRTSEFINFNSAFLKSVFSV